MWIFDQFEKKKKAQNSTIQGNGLAAVIFN